MAFFSFRAPRLPFGASASLRPYLNPLIAALFLTSGALPSVEAGQFSVTPVRIFMAPRDRAVAVTVTNDADTELVMQADIYQWRQKPNGEDDLTLSEDMILAPPIVKIPPKSRQVLRLALLKPVQPGEQQTYRLLVREIPEARIPEVGVQLQIAIAFSLPVFVTPTGVKRQIDCTLERSTPEQARAVCENRGNAYAQLTHFELASAAGQTLAIRDLGGYLLPTTKRSFELSASGGAGAGAGKIAAGPAKLTVTFDDGTTQAFDVALPQ